MRITLSERQFTEQIRQLEGLGQEVTLDEISHRMDRYARKLFVHLQEYGVQMLAGVQVHGTLANMQASLKPSWDEESVQTRLNGLALLAPTSISVDQPDLSAFVTNPIMLASMSDRWVDFGASLQRITLSELRPTLESIAAQLLSAPAPAPTNEFEQELQQLEYNAFLAASGKRDPLKKYNEQQEFQRREEEAYAAQKQAAHDAFWGRREED
jgi:hypothetical protein